VINFLDAVHTGARDARRLLAFCVEETIDVAAHRALAIERDIQTGENVLHPVDAALEKSRRSDRSGSDFQEFTYVASVDWQVGDLIGVERCAGHARGCVHRRSRTVDLDAL